MRRWSPPSSISSTRGGSASGPRGSGAPLRFCHAGGGLTEQYPPRLVVERGAAAEVLAERPALLHAGSTRDGVPPARDVGKVGEDLPALVLGEDPRPRRDVGDRVLAREVGSVREAPLEDAEQAVHLAREAVD